jgi:polyisoprenoid-binding protein YceI
MTVLPRSAMLAALLAAALPAAAQSSGFPGPAAAMPSGGPVKGARYVIDPTHTFVNYEIGHYGTTTNRGRFSTKDGSVTIDAAGGGRVEITMDMSSVNTGVDLLNRHIQSKDFLNIADFPTSRFVADKLRIDDNKVREVEGTLTLLGRTLPVTLRANKFNCYLSPMINRQVCGGDFETTIERSRWGVNWGLNFGFEDQVRLLVQVEAINVPQ